MKKNLLLIISLFVLFVSCATDKEKKNELSIKPERTVPANAPKSARKAVKKAPKDALVGVGSAKMSDIGMTRTTAEARARAEIARQINNVTTVIVRYYSISNKVDSSAEAVFKETISVSLSTVNVSGAVIVREEMDKKGTYWVVVMMNKSNLITHISAVQDEAKTAVPAMASFDAGSLISASIR